MPYGRRYYSRRPAFRRTRGRYAYRPTAYRRTKVSWWKRRRARYSRKYPSNFALRNQQLMKLKWADMYSLDASASGSAYSVFRLNSLYDPQYAVGGGTPTGLAQASTLYARYKVMAAKVKVRFRASSNNDMIAGIIARSDQWTPPATSREWQQTLLEMDSSTTNLQGQLSSNASFRTISRFYKMRTVLGKEYYNDVSASAAVSANPASAALLYVAATSPQGAVMAGTSCWAQISITFYCKFYNNKVQVTD